MIHKIFKLIFPPKCILCQKLLTDSEKDICSQCKAEVSPFPPAKHKLTHISEWSALWHYEPLVRQSIIRFKFANRPIYGMVYGKYLAEKVLCEGLKFDIITSVPISRRRKWKRGYDQTRIIAEAISDATGKPYIPLLRKVRHTKPQSLLRTAAERRANIMGSFAMLDSQDITGKEILLVDDVITTGSTVSECARVLLTAGTKTVSCAATASALKKM